MSAITRMSVRAKVCEGGALKWALFLYAICSLISMAAMSVSAGLVLAALIFTSPSLYQTGAEFLEEVHHSRSRKYLIFSLVLFTACLLSLILGILNPLQYGDRLSEIHFLPDVAKLWYLFWPLVLVMALRRLSLTERKFVIRGWMGAFTFLSVIGIVQYFTGWPRPQPIPGSDHFHATLFLGHHLSTASIFIFPFFAALDLCLRSAQERMSKSTGLRTGFSTSLAYGTAAGLGGMALLATFSRTLWIALPIGVLIWILLSLQKPKLFLYTLLMAILGGYLLNQTPAIESRRNDWRGLETRKLLWEANFEFFKQRPLMGVGLRHNHDLSASYFMYKKSPRIFRGHAHNNFLDFLGGTGLLGTLAWLAWCGLLFWLFLRKSSLPFSNGLACAWIVFHLNGLTQVNFWEGKVEHQLAWVIAWALL